MWFYLALLSGFFLSLRRISEKPLTGTLDYFTLGWTTQLFSLPLIIVLFLLSDRDIAVTSAILFWLPLLVIWLFLYPVQTFCYFRAIHIGNLSEVVPILSFIPIFTMIIAWVLVGEIPSFNGFIGICGTVAGVFLLNVKSWKNITHIYENKAALLMFFSSFSVAVGSTLDKVALSVSNPRFYTLMNVAGAFVVLLVISSLRKKLAINVLRQYIVPVFGVGIFQSLFYSSYMFAVQQGVTSYIVALRNTNVLVSAGLGIFFLREALTAKKLIAYLFIAVGLIFIAYA